MRDSTPIAAYAWPSARGGEAVVALGRSRGWATGPRESAPFAAAGGDSCSRLDLHAARSGLEAEPVECDHAGIARLLERCAPALLALPGGGLIAVLERRGRRLRVLDPDHARHWVRLEAVGQALGDGLAAGLGLDIDAIARRCTAAAPNQGRVRAALRDELLARQRLHAGWLVRPASRAPLRGQAGELGIGGLPALFIASHAVGFLLWLGAWWLLGQGAFSGHLDIGWLQAWALLLATLLPLRLLTSGTGGLLALRAGALLKRRLLAGALALEPEEIRHLGVGRLLGCTLEAEALEGMVAAGGLFGLTGLVELVMAAVALSLVPLSGPLYLLAAWMLAGAALAALYLRRLRAWTEARLALTDTLVDTLVGHRTRAIQEPKEQWNAREDLELSAYFESCRGRDRAALLLSALPRGALLLGVAALAPAFAGGTAMNPAALAATLGGLLAARLAFHHLASGAEQLLGAWVAFGQIRLFWDAAGRPETPARPGPAPGEQGSALVEAHNIAFHHAGRAEPILRGASLRVCAGDRMLLQGASGSGKSTLAAILCGHRLPHAGLCLADGLDRASLGEREWRRRIALVPQFHENHILMGPLAFNLLLGRDWPPTREDLEEAEALCRELDLGPLLERMPGGLMQQVGETGWQLSHGERERIYLARALLQGAAAIVLDESVSALDPATLRDTMSLLWERTPALVLIAHI